MKKKKIAIFGGGTATLFFASFIDTRKYQVTIYEKNKTLGRKFLVAGDGGFNLTHAEDITKMIEKYTPSGKMSKYLKSFTNNDLRYFLSTISIPTFVGTSKRVYPEKGIKPIMVLNKLLDLIKEKGIVVKKESPFEKIENANIYLPNNIIVNSDINIFALGGASWSVTGSDGSWFSTFEKSLVEVKPFKPTNCEFETDWSEEFKMKYKGIPIKNIAISINRKKTIKGELNITEKGIIGGPIYALSNEINSDLEHQNKSTILIDLKPDLTHEQILNKLASSKNTSEALRKLKIPKAFIELIRLETSKGEYLNLPFLSRLIGKFPIRIKRATSLDKAISTSGGIAIEAVDENLQLKKLPSNYCMGEMINWNCPTGGYLIQGCASMGVYLARHLNEQEITSS